MSLVRAVLVLPSVLLHASVPFSFAEISAQGLSDIAVSHRRERSINDNMTNKLDYSNKRDAARKSLIRTLEIS